MKKQLCFIIMMVFSLCINAQWRLEHVPADELKGTKEYDMYSYVQDDLGAFSFYGFDEYQFKILSKKGIFNVEREGRWRGCLVLVGMYTEDDKLYDSFKLWLDAQNGSQILQTRNMGTMSNPVGQKGKVRRMLDFLQRGKGYVRIVAPRYADSDFDIHIPCPKTTTK